MIVECSGRAGCGATWTGVKIEHCTICHASFPGTSLGDAHQVATDDPGRRRCLTADEMMAKGWTSTVKGDRSPVWHGPAPEKRHWLPAQVVLGTPSSGPVADTSGAS